jgi:hypoxanthine-guanine phosphoribosyltransferase
MGHLPVSRYESVVITSGPAGSTHQLIIIIIIEGPILFVAQLSKGIKLLVVACLFFYALFNQRHGRMRTRGSYRIACAV